MILPGLPAPVFPLQAGRFFGLYLVNSSNCLIRWQSRMETRGWYINPDGFFGPKTHKVVVEFQAEKKLLVDGKIGPVTWSSAWILPMIDRRETHGKYTIWR